MGDLEFVAAFDVDENKVGKSLDTALKADPNNTITFCELDSSNVLVDRGPTLDGLGSFYRDIVTESTEDVVDVEQILRDRSVDVLVCYMPVGSEEAAKFYAEAALRAGVAFVNAMPVFIASDPEWAEKFRLAGVPIVGDDVKSQLGATITHRVLARLFESRGVTLDRTYQLNVGGNMDFKNMLERKRLQSKKISKTRAVTSNIAAHIDPDNVHIGPSDHVPWLEDRKFAYVRLEGRGFGDAPVSLEYKLEVWDSPNSAGSVIDAIRAAKMALDAGYGGPLDAASAYFMKSPRKQQPDDEARADLEEFIARAAFDELQLESAIQLTSFEAGDSSGLPTGVISRPLHDEIDSTLIVETDSGIVPRRTIVEKKGLGHPDTMADHLAEALSQAYSNWTLREAGAVLHHNFDKLTMHGGGVDVSYGGGGVTEPIKIMVNGRATRRVGSVSIPVEEIIQRAIIDFFESRLPVFSDHLDIVFNLSSNSSPGAVKTGDDSTDRENWFDIESIEDLRERKKLISNDTSMGTGFFPETKHEQFVRELVEELSGDSPFREENPWCGTDVKMMLVSQEDSFEAIIAVPQISTFVHSRQEYQDNLAVVLEHCRTRAAEALGEEVASRSSFRLNARDLVESDELYLTLSGSSLESGDEGVVGRGNRANGLITPLRAMNLEGVNGKNPIYHIGKLYNLAAQDLAERLAQRLDCHCQVTFVSATGQELDYPWKVIVRTSVDVDPDVVEEETRIVTTGFPALTKRILAGDLVMA